MERREREREEGERSVRIAKNRCILCSDPSRSLSCNAVPSGRTVCRERSVNALYPTARFFFFSQASLFFFCVCHRVCISYVLSRSRIRLRVSRITASGACNIRVATALPDREHRQLLRCFPKEYHVSHILIPKILMRMIRQI